MCSTGDGVTSVVAVVFVVTSMFNVIIYSAASRSAGTLLQISDWVLRLQYVSLLSPLIEVRLKSNGESVSFLAGLMNFCSLFNFEIRFSQPGCAFPAISQLTELYGTMGSYDCTLHFFPTLEK